MQVSYSFSSQPTRDQTHLNLLRLLPKESHLAGGVAGILHYFDWHRIVVLSEDAPVFISVSVKS